MRDGRVSRMLVFKSTLSLARMDTGGSCAAQAMTMFTTVQTLTRSKLATIKSGNVGGASGASDDGRALHGRLSTLAECEIELAKRDKRV